MRVILLIGAVKSHFFFFLLISAVKTQTNKFCGTIGTFNDGIDNILGTIENYSHRRTNKLINSALRRKVSFLFY